jgi:hypothetical protein
MAKKFRGRIRGQGRKTPRPRKMIVRKRTMKMKMLGETIVDYYGLYRIKHLTGIQKYRIPSIEEISLKALLTQLHMLTVAEYVNFPYEVLDNLYTIFNDRFDLSVPQFRGTFEEYVATNFNTFEDINEKIHNVISTLGTFDEYNDYNDYQELETMVLFNIVRTDFEIQTSFLNKLNEIYNRIKGSGTYFTAKELTNLTTSVTSIRNDYVNNEYNVIFEILDTRALLELEKTICRYIFYLFTLGREFETRKSAESYISNFEYIETEAHARHYLNIYKDTRLYLDMYYSEYRTEQTHERYNSYNSFVNSGIVNSKIDVINYILEYMFDMIDIPLTLFTDDESSVYKAVKSNALDVTDDIPMDLQTKQIFALGDTLHDFGKPNRGIGDLLKHISIDNLARIINGTPNTYNMTASDIENKLLKEYLLRNPILQTGGLVFLRVNYKATDDDDIEEEESDSKKKSGKKAKVLGEGKESASGLIIGTIGNVRQMQAYPQVSEFLKTTIGNGINYVYDTGIANASDNLIRRSLVEGTGQWFNRAIYPKLWDPSTSSKVNIQPEFNELYGVPSGEGEIRVVADYNKNVFMSVYAKTYLQIYLKSYAGRYNQYQDKMYWARDPKGSVLQWRLILFSARSNREYDVTQDEPWLSSKDTFNSVPNMKIILWCLAKQMHNAGGVLFSFEQIKKLAKEDKIKLQDKDITAAMQSLCNVFMFYEFTQDSVTGDPGYTLITIDPRTAQLQPATRGFNIERKKYNSFLTFTEVIMGLLFDLKRSGDWGMIEYVRIMNKNLKHALTTNQPDVEEGVILSTKLNWQPKPKPILDGTEKIDAYRRVDNPIPDTYSAPWMLWSGDRPAGLAACYNNIPVISALTTTDGTKHYFVNVPIDRNNPLFVKQFSQVFDKRIMELINRGDTRAQWAVVHTNLGLQTTVEAVRSYVEFELTKITGDFNRVTTLNEKTAKFSLFETPGLSESLFVSVVCFILDVILGVYNNLGELIIRIAKKINEVLTEFASLTGKRRLPDLVEKCFGIFNVERQNIINEIHQVKTVREVLNLLSTPNVGKHLLSFFLGEEFEKFRDSIKENIIGKQMIETFINYQPLIDKYIRVVQPLSGEVSSITMTILGYLACIAEMFT